ncbi:MAG: CpsD/CapB family tyrosine-protein kinase [Gammaproteobacteria bacterium]|nr:CpsD/CapB family tyrosine-protein kinase [Gammaproteobacteria bacterium]
MERIKKAIDRARKEREGVTEPVSSDSSVSRTVPSSPENITYTQTKIIDVSNDVLKRNRLVSNVEHDYKRDAFKLLRTQILQKMRANGWNSLAVTSAQPGEGKSLVAINLAMALAMEVNQTVLLVDFDLRRPSIHTYFEYEPDKGINDFLANDVPVQEILFTPGLERLVILPGKEPIYNSSEMLSSPKMVSLVNELKNRYPSRLIIFDLPPLLSTDDALAFSPYVDTVLLVIEEGKTSKEDLLTVKGILKDTNIIGTVLNKSDSDQQDSY